jgi:hypothetical protein
MVASAELLVAESPPQVPACHGSERTPLLTEALDVVGTSVDLRDGSFKSNVAQGKYVGLSKDHDAKHCECPGTDALDSG